MTDLATRLKEGVRRLGVAAPTRGPTSDLKRLPISLNYGGVSLAEGVRAGLSTGVVIAASEWLKAPGFVEAALAALFTCMCDPGGPIRKRLPALFGFCLAGAAITVGGGFLRGFGMAVALPIAALAIFCGTFLRIFGQSLQQVGTLLCVVAILSIDREWPDLASAFTAGGMFVLGGLWAILLAIGLWRIHPYMPARKAIAGVYQSLALLAQDLAALARHAAPQPEHWDNHARAHRRAVREAIETARAVAMETFRSRGPTSNRGARSIIRLEAADQIFGVLIALADLLETADAAERGKAAHILRRLRPILAMLSRTMLSDETEPRPNVARAIRAVSQDVAALPPASRLRRTADALVERLQIAATVTTLAKTISDASGRAQPPLFWRGVRMTIAANLDRRSLALRHALRATASATPAIAFTIAFFTPYDHWLTITIVATMQPYFGNTFARALERVGGTLLGGLLAALIGLFITSPLAIAAAMFPLAVLAFAIRAVSFGLFMAALTPMIVLLVEFGQPGATEWVIAGARAGLTVCGCLVAVASCYILWPSWEPDRLAGELRAAVGAHGRYAEAEFAYLANALDAASRDKARRAAGLATNNAEASISRALVEPGGDQRRRERLEAAMVIDAALRRFSGRLSSLAFDPSRGDRTAPQPLLAAWGAWIGDSMRTLAAGSPQIDARPPSAGGVNDEALRRIARQIELIAGTLDRISA